MCRLLLIVDLQLSMSPAAAGNEQLKQAAARALQLPLADITSLQIVRRSLDVRHKNPQLQLKLKVYTEGTPLQDLTAPPRYRNVEGKPPVVIVGAGPAGLFAALKLLEKGLRPVILDRGKPVEERKYDISSLLRERVVDVNSNWCFGEGGAGAYSDGKLYTRSNKRGNISEVLQQFVHHGAHPDMLVDAHPHIGTDKLPRILARIRETITGCGGSYHFNTCVSDFIVKNQTVLGVEDAQGNQYEGVAVILATGHSARDMYELFHRRRWTLEAKPFALGVRAEHPQALINEIQYGARLSQADEVALPPAAYSLTAQVGARGVFSFCMCPGGIMVPAVTASGETVVNGMSNSRRSSPYANAGIVAQVDPAELSGYRKYGVLAGLRFQQEVERRVHVPGLSAPAQRLVDFMAGKTSATLPKTSYIPGVVPAPLHELLPAFVGRSLQAAFTHFGGKMPGYLSQEAVLAAVESRTSSPVRMVRDPHTLQHVQLARLYPCGEGAGYAGGITSSAIDGIRCAEKIWETANG
ncbi:MAG: FAD-binding protein [Prevotellaceae bacterium]|nr:FAD-binding protein [Prevotellaceae bacterium]